MQKKLFRAKLKSDNRELVLKGYMLIRSKKETIRISLAPNLPIKEFNIATAHPSPRHDLDSLRRGNVSAPIRRAGLRRRLQFLFRGY